MKLENQFDGTIWLSDETKKEIELFNCGANIYEELKTRYECEAITEAVAVLDEVETMTHNLCTMFNGLIIDEA